MTRIIYLLCFFCLSIIVISCSTITPGGFWINYYYESIVSQKNDQGLWGGHREILWESEETNTFSSSELIEFAKKHIWKMVDTISLATDSPKTKIYTLPYSDDYSLTILNEHILPKLKAKDNKIYVFSTTWVAVEPGNARDSFANGFAVLNSDGTTLKIFFEWGE